MKLGVMLRRCRVRAPLGLLATIAVAALAVSPSLTPGADHEGDESHVETAHGGHGAFVEQQDAVHVPTFSFATAAPSAGTRLLVPTMWFSPLPIENRIVRPGRGPPRRHRPRAPPA